MSHFSQRPTVTITNSIAAEAEERLTAAKERLMAAVKEAAESLKAAAAGILAAADDTALTTAAAAAEESLTAAEESLTAAEESLTAAEESLKAAEIGVSLNSLEEQAQRLCSSNLQSQKVTPTQQDAKRQDKPTLNKGLIILGGVVFIAAAMTGVGALSLFSLYFLNAALAKGLMAVGGSLLLSATLSYTLPLIASCGARFFGCNRGTHSDVTPSHDSYLSSENLALMVGDKVTYSPDFHA